jgi:hypothetical protein
MNEVMMSGVRWANNIIVELASNYGHKVTNEQRAALVKTINALDALAISLRTGK